MVEAPDIYVLDASVAIKWLLPVEDEPHADIALRVLQDARDGRIGLISPPHLTYEIGHAITRAVRNQSRIITLEQGLQALETFYALNQPVLDWPKLDLPNTRWRDAWDLAHRYGCSYYDATYLELANVLGWPVVHADDALRRKLAGQFPYELWIEDYPSKHGR